MKPEEWQQRLEQAQALTAKGIACPLCGGTGGWPDPFAGGFVACKPCDGRGISGHDPAP